MTPMQLRSLHRIPPDLDVPGNVRSPAVTVVLQKLDSGFDPLRGPPRNDEQEESQSNPFCHSGAAEGGTRNPFDFPGSTSEMVSASRPRSRLNDEQNLLSNSECP